MTFKEIANKITGISIPIFGVSWTPPKLEKQIAEKIVIFLEDRRALYNPYELEVPRHCIESVMKTREFLTEQLYEVEGNSELGQIIRAMRSACRKFLDVTSKRSAYNDFLDDRIGLSLGLSGQIILYSAMGELRGVFGILISKLLIMHGIDCESDLLKILPLQYEDD